MDLLLKVIDGDVSMTSTENNMVVPDVIYDYYRWSIDEIQDFLTNEYGSSIDLKAEIGL